MSMSLSPPTDPSLQTVVSPIQIPKPAPIETNEKALPPRPVGPGPTSASATRTKSPSSSRVDRLFSPFSTPSRTKLVADDDVPTDTQYTEDELREIFEEEEMQRFLNAFHANVGEVTLPSADDDQTQPRQQKIVIVPAEDAPDVAKAGAAPPSASVEAAPVSLAVQAGSRVPEIKVLGDSSDDTDVDDDDDDDTDLEDDAWVDVGKTEPRVYQPEEALPSKKNHVHTQRPPPVWGSEKAAALLVSILPQGRAIEARNRRGGKHGKFTLAAMTAAGQRAYLATYPFYVPFMLNLWDTARWINWWKSARLCSIYWLLWWNNLLLPAFLLYIVYQLLKHRLLPYPTLEQLEARRRATTEAERFGDAFIKENSHTGPWKSSEGYSGLGSLNLGIGNATYAAQANAEAIKITDMAKLAFGAGKGAITGRFKKDKTVIDPETKMSTIEDDQMLVGSEKTQAGDWRRIGLLMTEELADLHERAKNLFLWRKPESSLTYTMVLAGAAVAIAFTPAQYLAKGTYAGLGFFYWFLIPVLCAMTRKQRAMLPSPLFDIPTDSEYAMEIIARRIAAGESALPDKKQAKTLAEAYGNRSKRDLVFQNKSKTSINTTGTPLSPVASIQPPPSTLAGVDGHSIAGDGSVDPRPSDITGTTAVGGVDVPAGANANEFSDVPGEFPGSSTEGRALGPSNEPHTYSAHHKHIPGIMTLSNTFIEFTPFLRHNPKVHIDIDRIRGVKKSGKRTLLVRYLEPIPSAKAEPGQFKTVDNPDLANDQVIVTAEKEEKFKWVGHRDEVFARIVASRGGEWIPV